MFAPTQTFLYFSLISMLVIFFNRGDVRASDVKSTTIIGAIIDGNSRKGKEEITAMKIAVENFNNNSDNHQLSLVVRNFTGELYRTALIAEELFKQQKVQVIVGMDTWRQAALAAEVENRPVVSLAAITSVRSSKQIGRPNLIQMGSNVSEQIRCISAVVQSCHWRKVIAIYEDDGYGGDGDMLTLLSEALQSVGSEIDYHLVLPPISFLSDPIAAVHEEFLKLLSIQPRVFIVLQSSLSMATHLFQEARRMGFMGRDSAWIFTDSISGFLDSMDTSVIPYMEGALGIKTYYSNTSRSFQDFSAQFQEHFQTEYPEENNTQPGIHALRAYDSIGFIGQALERLASHINTTKILLNGLLSSNFTGLTGEMSSEGGDLSNSNSNSNSLSFRIINLVGKSYKELDFWTQDMGGPFSGEGGDKNNSSRKTSMVLDGTVTWPGYLNRVPKGWEMPTVAKPLKIGVPNNSSFEKFVKVEPGQSQVDKKYTGFCIDIFWEVLKLLEQNYSLPYEFHEFDGTYDELVDCVYNKTFDAAVGDVTILANRSRKVEFTQPYAESGLVMIQVNAEEPPKPLMFMKPFTVEMWVATGLLMIHTMFIVWVLEYQSNNPEFRGPWRSQLGTVLWFTFSSLFFAHRETIRSNITRVVIVVWLFVVFILTSSYTASFSSMLTVQRLDTNVTDIAWLKANRSVIGCDGDSFVRKYLENVIQFKKENIKNISSENAYNGEFKSGNITAAFLELPYKKVFINRFCRNYTASKSLTRFGGLGFAFQKGSPLAADFSGAILTISEKGILKKLEDKWFSRSVQCSATGNDELSLRNFWPLYLLCGATSTICFLLFFFRLVINFRRQQEATPADESVWIKIVELGRYFHHGQSDQIKGRLPNLSRSSSVGEWITPCPRWSTASPSDAPFQASEASPPAASLQLPPI